MGLEGATRALATAIEGALAQVVGHRTGEGRLWSKVRVVWACLGLASIDTPEDRERITPRVLVVNDSELVLAGGTPEGWGLGLISGTGSIRLGWTRDGRSARVGGWGNIFGDEGGYHMAVEALRTASQAADGRVAATGLLKGI